MRRFIILALLIPTALAFCQLKTLRQVIRSWPAGYDTTGKHWVVYNQYRSITHWVNELTTGSSTVYNSSQNIAMWSCQVGNFNGGTNPWSIGDTLVALGSVDSVYIHDAGGYGNRINHCGFYWIFSDTIVQATPESWTPDDTLRVMPKPIVFKRGPGGLSDDTVYIRIPNPRETRDAALSQYDVMGYLIYADTTGTGTPNAYNNILKTKKVKFLVRQGVFGDTTTYKFLESSFAPANIEWPVYFAYKIGSGPDTTVSTADTSGYVTYYFSMNSDSIHVLHNVVGVEEQNSFVPAESRLVVAPNPFTGVVRISVEQTDGNREIMVYDINGCVVKSFGVLAVEQMPFGQLYWNGRDNQGDLLPAGVYFVEVKTASGTLNQKVILER